MQYIAEGNTPDIPESRKPRLKAALEKAKEAHVAIIRNEDVPEEVLDLVEALSAAQDEIAAIWKAEFEYEKYWGYLYYFRLYGEHLDAPDENRPAGEIIDFTETKRRLLKSAVSERE